MTLLGTLINLIVIGFTFSLGYTGDERYFLLLFTPIVFMLGHGTRQSAKSAHFFGGTGFGLIKAMISTYLMGLILSAICYGLGYGVMEILKFRPS